MQESKPDLTFYPVEAILDRKLIQGKVYYLVKWKDFPKEEATWEYSKKLPFIKPLIRSFNHKTKIQKGGLNQYYSMAELCPQDDSQSNLRQEATRQHLAVRNNTTNFANSMPNADSRHTHPCWKLGNGFNLQKSVSEEKGEAKEKQAGMVRWKTNMLVNIEESSDEQNEESLDSSRDSLARSAVTVSSQPSKQQMNAQKSISIIRHFRQSQLGDSHEEVPASNNFAPQDSTVSSQPQTRKVRRICHVGKLEGGGVEYFLEEEGGKLSVVSGRELLRSHPVELLEYLQGVIMKKDK